MKQVQIIKGFPLVISVPAPACRKNQVLVKNHYSLISTGTELAAIGQTPLAKIMKKPALLKKTAQKIMREGYFSTSKQIQTKLNQGFAPGYSSSGTVIEVGENVIGFAPGDRVACAGASANHAEYITVPQNLTTKIPFGVTCQEAAFAAIGSIAMNAVRRARPTIGETVAVTGLGLIGMLTCKILSANGVNVMATDINQERQARAERAGFNAKQPAEGFDAVIITADTKSSAPVNLGVVACRKRGRVVIVGNVGLDLVRKEMYKKEIDIRMVTSYGPGRYERNYEKKGLDYPLAFVRWTENRNMQAFLNLIATKKMEVKSLMNKSFSINRAPNAYEQSKKDYGFLFEYDGAASPNTFQQLSLEAHKGSIRVGLIGAGAFAQSVHLPNLAQNPSYKIHGICDHNGVKAMTLARQYGASFSTTNPQAVFHSEEIDVVFICSRHDSHAGLAVMALKAGKHVLVEKPLALNHCQLQEIKKQLEKTRTVLMVGHNRKFSRYAQTLKKLLYHGEPVMILYEVDAGKLPVNSWMLDSDEGGGKLIGEAVHFIDFANFITGSKPVAVNTFAGSNRENFVLVVEYENKSLFTLVYSTMGSKSKGKENITVFQKGNTFSIKDFENLQRNTRNEKMGKDKGFVRELEELARGIHGEKDLTENLEQDVLATEMALDAINKLRGN